jgi:DNA modification methylase
MYKLIHGDCLEVMPTLEANSVDTVITDPPYGLSFMGKEWDHGVPGVQFWREALRVAKPGAMLLAFGGTRTFHRLTCAIEDAGWEVRDVLSWLYGSGFPKSLDISKAIDKAAGAERPVIATVPLNAPGGSIGATAYNNGNGRYYPPEPRNITAPATPTAQQWHGWGTGLKPAWEPIILAMKPLDGTYMANALKWGVCGLNIEGGRIPITDGATMARNNKPGANGWKNSSGGPNAAALNGEPSGRWPANLLLDEEAAAGAEWARFFYVAKASRTERNTGLEGMERRSNAEKDGRNQYKNGAARNGSGKLVNGDGHIKPQENHHPTVKPLALMRYLCRLTATPTGGVVLDPFMGSGTTGVAALMEGRQFIGIELDADYLAIAERRLACTQPALFEAGACSL